MPHSCVHSQIDDRISAVEATLRELVQRFDIQEETRKQEAKVALEQAWQLAKKSVGEPVPPTPFARSTTTTAY